MEYYQQGDVIIDRIVKPNNLKTSKEKVFAEGESTGHFHGCDTVEFFNADADRLVAKAQAFSKVYHQEHKDILIDEGYYERRFVQEYDHFAEEARNVVD